MKTLPQSLIDLIGEYGYARTDGVSVLERIHIWRLLIEAIKTFAAGEVEAERAKWHGIATRVSYEGNRYGCEGLSMRCTISTSGELVSWEVAPVDGIKSYVKSETYEGWK